MTASAPLGDPNTLFCPKIRSMAGDRHPKRLPDPHFEVRAVQVERQIDSFRRRLDEAEHSGHQRLERRVLNEPRPREAVLEVTQQSLGIIPEEDGADTPVARGDENRSERGGTDRDLDRWLCQCRLTTASSFLTPRRGR